MEEIRSKKFSSNNSAIFCYTKIVSFLDIFFPKYCVNCKTRGDYICANCFSFISFDVNAICLVCNKGSIDGLTHPGCAGKYTIDGAFSAIAYKGIVKKLIYSFKYKPYLSDLKSVLTDLFYEAIIQNSEFNTAYKNKPVLVPIPLSGIRFRRRGYNHAKVLAQGLSKKLDLNFLDALKRTRETKSQFGLSQKERKENIKGAFETREFKDLSKISFVFLVDDILTSGSTLLEASRTLKRSGVKKVWGIALARD